MVPPPGSGGEHHQASQECVTGKQLRQVKWCRTKKGLTNGNKSRKNQLDLLLVINLGIYAGNKAFGSKGPTKCHVMHSSPVRNPGVGPSTQICS